MWTSLAANEAQTGRCLEASGDSVRQAARPSGELRTFIPSLRFPRRAHKPLVCPQLSPSILGGLHEISRCVSARNYQQGLEVHTQVVSSSNFSEISAFMPVLKVLMTLANKLAVWLRRSTADQLCFKNECIINIPPLSSAAVLLMRLGFPFHAAGLMHHTTSRTTFCVDLFIKILLHWIECNGLPENRP